MADIKLATIDDMDWINTQYAYIDFVLSNIKNEIIVIATVGIKKAGIGRLVKIDEGNYEMGGIYVLNEFRGEGIAGEIVNELVNIAKQKKVKNLYCIPFIKLEGFYRKYGFERVKDIDSVPKKILEKCELCNSMYEEKTSLMRIEVLIIDKEL